MHPEVGVVIVGGGLAGSTLATLLARSGRDVLLVERSAFPRDKLCGEFLSAESQDVLRQVGVFDRIEAARPPRIHRARFIGPSGRTVRIRLPAPALGISRKRLDAELFGAAESAGATAWTKAEVTGITAVDGGHAVDVRRVEPAETTRVVAQTVVCAHGRRGRPDRALSRSFLEGHHPYAGLKRHHRPVAGPPGDALARQLHDHVEIYPFDGGYCGMSFIETGEVNVCMLVHEAVLRSTDKSWDSVVGVLADQHPFLGERLEALTPTDDKALAVAAVPFTPKSRFEQGVFFVGDAAGMIAPLAGDGQAMALESAHKLAAILPAAGADESSRADAGRRWERQWRASYRTRMTLAGGLQRLLLKPGPAEWALSVVGSVPGLPDLLGRMTRS